MSDFFPNEAEYHQSQIRLCGRQLGLLLLSKQHSAHQARSSQEKLKALHSFMSNEFRCNSTTILTLLHHKFSLLRRIWEQPYCFYAIDFGDRSPVSVNDMTLHNTGKCPLRSFPGYFNSFTFIFLHVFVHFQH